MIRTQISLTTTQYSYLKERSDQTGESLSSMIRRAIEHLKKLESSVIVAEARPDAGAFEQREQES